MKTNIIFEEFWLLYFHSTTGLILVSSDPIIHTVLKGQFYQRPPLIILYQLTPILTLQPPQPVLIFLQSTSLGITSLDI